MSIMNETCAWEEDFSIDNDSVSGYNNSMFTETETEEVMLVKICASICAFFIMATAALATLEPIECGDGEIDVIEVRAEAKQYASPDKTEELPTMTEITTTTAAITTTAAETTVTTTVSETTTEATTVTTQTTPPVTTEPVSGSQVYMPLNYDNIRALWFTFLDYEQLLKGRSAAEFEASMRARFSNAAAMGINTVFVHVRAHGDAYYKSALFAPAAEYTEGYDPLEIMLRAAHDNGLSFHAWINPLRADTTERMDSMDGKYRIKQWYDEKRGDYIIQSGEFWYLNPAYEDVRRLTAEGVAELINGYAVDGIHIDDYFYPTQAAEFDAAAFAQSGSDDLRRWRKENVNELVSLLYGTVKGCNSKVLFGISPQGLSSANEAVSADIKLWAVGGWCDYIVPQLYYGFLNESAPFEQLLAEWRSCTSPEVKLIIGLCTYKCGKTDSYAGSGASEWLTSPDVASRQAACVLAAEDCDGIALYSYASTFSPDVGEERARIAALLGKE